MTIAEPTSLLLPAARSTLSEGFDTVYLVLYWMSVALFFLIVGAAVYFSYRYKRQPGDEQKLSPPPFHSTSLELFWSIGPLLVCLGFFHWGVKEYMNSRVAPAGALEVRVYAQKWSWLFEYSNGKQSPDLYVPANQPVKLIMTSKDVLHSFFVPNYRIKYDAIPGRYTMVWFEAREPGEDQIFCTEYCGKDHSNMLAKVVVMPPADFPKWFEDVREMCDGKPCETPVAVGQSIYNKRACVSCHSIDGSPRVGPTFKGLFGKTEQFADGSTGTVDDNYIRESLLNPNAKIVKGFAPQMPTYQGQLKDPQIEGVIEFIKSLKLGPRGAREADASRPSDPAAPAESKGSTKRESAPMAATDIAVSRPREHDPGRGVDFFHASSGLKSWLFTLDHKRIGLMYLASTIFAFFLGGVFALLLRLEHLTPGQTFVDAQTYNQFFTLHGAIMVFMFIIPSIPAALGNFFLPIMVGAKDVAFPKLNLLSYYIYVLGSLIAVFSIVSNGVDTGWTFYTPYSSSSSETSVLPMVLGAFVLGFSSILTGVNFIVTVHKLRAPGITWWRLPLFLWSVYSTAIIQVLATPVLAITLLLLVMERAVGVGIFDPKLGGDPVLFQHFFWFYSHPAVYIMILPGMGIISELIGTFTRKKVFGYKAVALSSLGLALVSFLVWGHHMFVSGQSEFATIVFSFLTFLVAIPSAIKVINWTATLYQASISLKTPMLYALAFIFMFTIGGLTGIFLGVLSVDVHLHDTYFVVAHFHYVMMGGTVIAFLGGLVYWWPKMVGRMYSERLGQISFALIFIGFNVTFFTQFFMGSQGMPRRYFNYLPQWQIYHQISTFGSWILGVGFLVFLWMLIDSLRRGEKAPDNPWQSLALEWQTHSPPVLENFAKTPVVTHGPYDYHLAKPAN